MNKSARSITVPAFTRFSIKEQTFFAKRMSFLIHAGVPLVECLHIIKAQTKSRVKVRVYEKVITDVSGGQYLSTSLAKFRRLFGAFTINLVRVGEQSGALSQNLSYLADELQKKHELQKKVLGTLVYPVFITVATLGVTCILTVYIFPKLLPIFTSLHVTLPLMTRVLITVSGYLRDFGLYTVLAAVAVISMLYMLRVRFERFRFAGDRILLYIPVAGRLTRVYNLANFCRTLGLLLRSGIPLTEALGITADTTHNRVFRQACHRLSAVVTRGEPLSRGLLALPGLYPDILCHMVGIGEKTGTLSTSLSYLGQMYEGEVDELTKALSSSIEPLLMVVMGIVVGFIAVSVITPIYSITQQLQPH